MSKFNTPQRRPVTAGPIRTIEAQIPQTTHEGGVGYLHEAKSELFTTGVVNLVEDKFYESAMVTSGRFAKLVRECAVADPVWTAGFIGWLRTGANIRSASIAAAAEYVYALSRTEEGKALGDLPVQATVRRVVDSVLQRADEPGEILAYWTTYHGRTLPKGLKRGVADALVRLYTGRSALKYDTDSKGWRFGDVIDYVEPRRALNLDPSSDEGTRELLNLFGYLVDRRHGRTDRGKYPMPHAFVRNAELRAAAAADPRALVNPAALRAAGMTWEDVLSLAGDRVPKADLWQALIPSMGIMALARNLRNFDEAGVGRPAVKLVTEKFRDPAQIASSRMFPLRWYSAAKAAPSTRWEDALEEALEHSTRNIPALKGRTLIMIDTSGSMSQRLSERSSLSCYEAAAVIAFSLAARQGHDKVDVHGFGDFAYPYTRRVGGSVLAEVKAFCADAARGPGGHGTAIAESTRAAYAGHDRVFIFTDMQTGGGDVNRSVPESIPLYGWNLGGYGRTAIDSTKPNRVELAGLTDAMFQLVPLLEARGRGRWPWEGGE